MGFIELFTVPHLNESVQGTFIFYVKVSFYVIYFMFKYILSISYNKKKNNILESFSEILQLWPYIVFKKIITKQR